MNYASLKDFFLNPDQGGENVYKDFERHVQHRVRRNLPTLNDYDRDDLVTDICINCWKATPKHNPDYPFENYMNRIISNMIKKFIGRKSKDNEVEFNEEALEVEAPDQFKEIGADEIEREIIIIIHGLKNSDYKEIIKLIIQGLSKDEIAKKLNITKVTAATRRFRALKFLLKELEKAGIYI